MTKYHRDITAAGMFCGVALNQQIIARTVSLHRVAAFPSRCALIYSPLRLTVRLHQALPLLSLR